MNLINNIETYINFAFLNEPYASAFLRKLTIKNINILYDAGIKNIYIYINDIIYEKVILDEIDMELIDSKMLDLYLNDGNNKIDIAFIKDKDNIQIYTKNIKIDLTPIRPNHDPLLTNFIGNDDQLIEVSTGNADLEYQTPDAGEDKLIDIDLSIASHYFELKGVNSDLYRISKDHIPLIKSTIIRRPLNATFDYVEKMYDGNNIITNEVKKLTLDKGYYFIDNNKEYNDFGKTNFVREYSEKNINEFVVYKKDDIIKDSFNINTLPIVYESIKLTLDDNEAFVSEFSDDNAIIKFEENKIDKLSKTECDAILNGTNPYNGLCYYWFWNKTVDGNKKRMYMGIDSRECYDDNNQLIKLPITYTSQNLLNVTNWLNAFNHSILNFECLKSNEDDTIMLNANYISDAEKYKVKDNLTISYNYKLKESTYNVYQQSDKGYVRIDFDTAYFESKNITNNIQPIHLRNAKLTGDYLGDHSNNYQLSGYTLKGRIFKRPIYPHITFIDKIYDGNNNVAFNMDSAFYNGLENTIDNDDVFIDTTCNISPEIKNGKVDVITGNTIFYFKDPDVGDNKDIELNNIVLEGLDAKNYYIDNIYSTFRANISKRSIKIKINRIRLIRSDLRWEVDYEFDNIISSDNISIVINSNDANQFVVYGGVGYDETSNIDILRLYFNYSFNNNYQFKDRINEIQLVENTNSFYLRDEVRPAEPNTERIDVNLEHDTNYTGNMKLTAKSFSDTFTIEDPFTNNITTFNNKNITSYYESQDKKCKLYNGCKVVVKNICLDTTNPKAKNYILENPEVETILEIV